MKNKIFLVGEKVGKSFFEFGKFKQFAILMGESIWIVYR